MQRMYTVAVDQQVHITHPPPMPLNLPFVVPNLDYYITHHGPMALSFRNLD